MQKESALIPKTSRLMCCYIFFDVQQFSTEEILFQFDLKNN